jgi:hypothetical protein
VWRTHPPPHITLDSLAVATHCSAPSSPLVEELVGIKGDIIACRGGDMISIEYFEYNKALKTEDKQ